MIGFVSSTNRGTSVRAQEQLVRDVVNNVEKPFRWYWWLIFILCWLVAIRGLGWSSWEIATRGVGVLGVNNSVPWGWDVINFVFWIGIGHAGTLISAILLLTSQHWRSPISRAAELMTLCAVVCAAIFPVVHVGRIWVVWMISPAPEVSGVWPELSSPLIWDVLAVSTYFTLSCGYWLLGLLPDFAVLRDRCHSKHRRWIYGILAAGWQGSSRQWVAYQRASLVLAAVLTPLVITVHSVVSFDFAVTMVPGWHETIFPPYYVAGAILSGMAMVQIILLIVKRVTRASLGIYINPSILSLMSRFVLSISLLMGCFYLLENFSDILAGGHLAQVAYNRLFGVDSLWFWIMIVGNVVLPQLYWLRRLRSNSLAIIIISLAVLMGMWLERFIIIVGALKESFFPATVANYSPSSTDIWMIVGSFGLFAGLYLILVRLTPFFSICEMRIHAVEHPEDLTEKGEHQQ